MKHNVSADTIARTVCLVLALVNQALTICGYAVLPIDDDTVVQLVSLCWTAAASVVAWWKNNSFTRAAIESDQIMKAKKERGAE